jgi:predicted P-loop ATPase
MSEIAKARDWLGELQGLVATDQLEAFQELAKEALKTRPDLEDKVFAMAAEYTAAPKKEKAADFFYPTALPKDAPAAPAQPKPAPFKRRDLTAFLAKEAAKEQRLLSALGTKPKSEPEPEPRVTLAMLVARLGLEAEADAEAARTWIAGGYDLLGLTEGLSDRERGFIYEMKERSHDPSFTISEKQAAWFEKLYRKHLPGKRPDTKAVTVLDQRSIAFQHTKSPRGIPQSLENALVALDKLKLECRYDMFHDKWLVRGDGFLHDLTDNLDNLTIKVRQVVLNEFGFDPGSTFTYDAIRSRCLDRMFDPVRDYLDGLRWDGKPRLDKWLTTYLGASDNPLNRAMGRKTLVAAVRRVREPGCKFDFILVLEGRVQGKGKSTLLAILAGEGNFSDSEILALSPREQQEAVQGVWIYEIAELEGLHKSDVTKVKLFASKTVDRARPAYGRGRVDQKRRGIFVATTNEDTYLRDTTGNRRFWPVLTSKVDLDGIARDRDQLWAEAAAVEASGEPLTIPEALWPEATDAQAARLELDPWEDIVASHLAGFVRNEHKIDGSFLLAADNDGDPEWRVSTDYLLTEIIGLPKERQFHNHTKRLAAIMRDLGWSRHDTPIRIGKQIKRGFTRLKAEIGADT